MSQVQCWKHLYTFISTYKVYNWHYYIFDLAAKINCSDPQNVLKQSLEVRLYRLDFWPDYCPALIKPSPNPFPSLLSSSLPVWNIHITVAGGISQVFDIRTIVNL